MSIRRILPGAAGIIALTATIGFVDGQRETEYEGFSRGRITLVSSPQQVSAEHDLYARLMETSASHPTYLVEFRRGETSAKVLIDAETGRLITS